MAFNKEQLNQFETAAAAAGIPLTEVLAAAEAAAISQGDDGTGNEAALTADRFLIGFLPYVTVRELRTLVLGLEVHVADEELFTGEWLLLHGGSPAGQQPTLRERSITDEDEATAA